MHPCFKMLQCGYSLVETEVEEPSDSEDEAGEKQKGRPQAERKLTNLKMPVGEENGQKHAVCENPSIRNEKLLCLKGFCCPASGPVLMSCVCSWK